MQKIFLKYMCGVMAIAMIAIVVLNYGLQSRNLEEKMVGSSLSKLNQISNMIASNKQELNTLTSSIREDYLTRASVFAYIIAQNPAVLESQSELKKIKLLLNVDELHVIDERGILVHGTVPIYFGMDFRSTEQTAEFLQILSSPSFKLMQSIRPNGAEQKVFQYVGVARTDQPGIVQIGLEPHRQVEARKRNELPYIFSRMPLGADNDIFAIEIGTNIILAHSDKTKVGKSILELGYPEDYLVQFENGGFFRSAHSEETRFYLMRQYGDFILGVSQSKDALYAGRQAQMLLVCLYLFCTFLIVILVIRYLLKRKIVGGVQRIMGDLGEITSGNLDKIVDVNDNPELTQLSLSINTMVENILETTVKISRIIDMVEVPIGVYEYKTDMERVLATDRLRYILSLTEEEANAIYRNKSVFIRKLQSYKSAFAPEEEDVYKICEAPAKWIRMRTVSDATGTFGVIIDVTKEMLEKQKIKQERDYDSLTNLRSRRSFTRLVTEQLKSENLGVAALVMLDLDAFKGVNDRYGHDIGDTYLRITADFLSELCKDRKRCIAGRRSGDEFYLFMSQFASKEEIRNIVLEFYNHLETYTFVFPDETATKIRISAGLAWLDRNLVEFDDLLRAADHAMYEAKANPSKKFCEYLKL